MMRESSLFGRDIPVAKANERDGEQTRQRVESEAKVVENETRTADRLSVPQFPAHNGGCRRRKSLNGKPHRIGTAEEGGRLRNGERETGIYVCNGGDLEALKEKVEEG